ncbi:Hypothetical protein NCS54_01196700 [Fusarium falciforme]|uniref:Hypothetical protein n=1 Tax=Fusarium falciforme TaxID=195108 RepID=UPI0023017547|nr:Hypothetical protein NCS54_01196700 [Fusarium falciforme]WAO94386.1 Hypothetical protein NCS54_01196700 [Fusarium falciforme]
MTRKDDAVAGSQERGIERSPEPHTYCFQAWHFSDSPVTETFHGNQAMARHLEGRLSPGFAQVLRIRASIPANRRQTLIVPRTIYVSVRQDAGPEVDEEDVITAFRDEHYGGLVRAYFRTELHKTLDFYNCFVCSPNGKVTRNHFAKVMVTRAFSQTMDRELRLPREESWGDIGTGISGPAPQSNGAAPQAAPQAAPDRPPNDTGIQRVTDALRNFFEWLTAQSEIPEAIATAGTANSYCRFKETTETLITLLRSLNRAYERGKGEAIDVSKIWTHLVRADAARRHGQELTINLNQTGLLDAVVKRHSATRSTAYAIGSVGGVGAAIWGAYALTGLPMFAIVVAGCAAALVAGNKSLDHKEYRDRVKQVKDDFDSFRQAWDTVARTLALQFAASMGVDLTIQDEDACTSII